MSKKLVYLASLVIVIVIIDDVSADLVGYWKLDENSGVSTADSSGYGNNGILIGPTWIGGKSGSALDFDGVDDYVLCAERIGTGPGTYPEILMPENFTVSCWTKLDNFAYFSSFVGNGIDTGDDECGFFLYNWGWVGENEQDFGLAIRTESGMNYVETPNIYQTNTWYHLAATYDGTNVRIYVNGALVTGPEDVGGPIRWISATSGNYPERFAIGVWLDPGYDLWIDGVIDEVGYWNHVLNEVEIKKLAAFSKASEPAPVDGSIHADTWASLSWVPGAYAVSHDLYIGDNFDDVNDGAEITFIGNLAETFFVIGFPGNLFPDGLIPGTTYYWRIDEVNDADPNSPWKGDIWSFSIPPRTAYSPKPADSAESVELDTELSWTAGFGAKLHTVYFGESFDEVDNATNGQAQGTTTYAPGALKMAKTYYWRVDEFDVGQTHKGNVWSFTTQGGVMSLDPANGAVDVIQKPVLTWSHGVNADSHQVYFGTNPEAVKNANTGSPEYKGTGNLGSESYEPGQLEWNTTYYWRVDETNNVNADSPWTGPLWSFTTANFLVIDDFESYNDIDEGELGSNRIYLAWVDGYDNPAVNGSVVGHPFAELNIVHGGLQSMPMAYDNAVGKSEATLTLTSNRDWTVNGVNTLTIWFRGAAVNDAEPVYVALNDITVVTHNDPDAARTASWIRWNIDLQAFVDQGVNLANINTITLGLGHRNNPVAGGSGMMYYDDIRLYALTP
ncbi:MAG: LamG domain-containing protein [Planctomycetota bacterium]|jgi:hypothetical protein